MTRWGTLAAAALLLGHPGWGPSAVAAASDGGMGKMGRMGRMGRRGEEHTTSVLMRHHSFSPPLQFEEELDDWFLTGASLVQRNEVLMHPGMPGKHGFLFSKEPLLTDNFEVIVQFKLQGDGPASKDQSFAFFFVEGNVSAGFDEKKVIQAASWADGLEELGFTLSGFFKRFKGFGAVLSTMNGAGKDKPVVSYIDSDGMTDLKYGVDVPTKEAKGLDFRNTLNSASLRIRVTPDKIEGEMKQSPSLSWNQVFSIERNDNTDISPTLGAYMGFTAWSGTGEQADRLSITKLEVLNHDETSIGENVQEISSETQMALQDAVADDKRHLEDQIAQREQISKLIKMLSDSHEKSQSEESKMFQDLEKLNVRVTTMGDGCKEVVKEVDLLMKSSDPKAHVGAMVQEIVGLRRIFVKDSQVHKTKVDTVQKKVSEIKETKSGSSGEATLTELAQKSKELEEVVQKQTSAMSYMLMIIFIAVALMGYLVYGRLNYYEKKHFV